MITNFFVEVCKRVTFSGVDTKRRITKQQNQKTATVTKQRLLQNSNYYKTVTVAKQQNHKTATITKLLLLLLYIYPNKKLLNLAIS